MGAQKKGAAGRVSEDSVEQSRQRLQAILLADSFATKYRPVTLERPKVLLPIVNVPMIDYTLAWLESAGIEEVFVFCCAHSTQVIDYLENSEWFSHPNLLVRTIESHKSISAGDALRYMYEQQTETSQIQGDFVLVSGDTVSNMPLAGRDWDNIRAHHSKVPWHPIVWFSQGVPRFSFIVWLAFLNRLSTGDRMKQWGRDQHCSLCGDRDETRDHLFFACPYSYIVWTNLCSTLLAPSITPEWTATTTYLLTCKKDLKDIVLGKMAFQTTIYHLWRERNSRIHGRKAMCAASLTRWIDKTIRNRISSFHYTSPHKLHSLMQRWFELRTRQ